jgi:hypothetical protein
MVRSKFLFRKHLQDIILRGIPFKIQILGQSISRCYVMMRSRFLCGKPFSPVHDIETVIPNEVEIPSLRVLLEFKIKGG